MMRSVIKKMLKESNFDWMGKSNDLPFTAGKRIPPKEVPKNTIVIRMEWMHGDADVYTRDKFEFNLDDIRDSNNFIILMKGLRILEKREYRYVHDWGDLYGALERGGLNERERETVRDYWEGDSTSDYQYPANLNKFEATYYDDEGIEREIIWND